MCASAGTVVLQSGTPVVQGDCVGSYAQQWTLRASADAFQLVSANTNLCLVVDGGSKAAGAAVKLAACAAVPEKLWTVTTSADGTRRIAAAHSGLCLGVSGAGMLADTPLAQQPCDGGAAQAWRVDVASISAWGDPVTLPIVPVAVASLPSGSILAWSAEQQFAFATGTTGQTYSTIFNPVTSRATERLVSNTGHDMFCPGISLLSDGRVFVTGGSDSDRTSLYDEPTDNWLTGAPMKIGRGYHASTLLSDGTVFTVGGSWSGPLGAKVGEVWSPASGWSLRQGVAAEPMSGDDPDGIYRGDNHMWLFGYADRWVFKAGPAAAMHWIDTSGSGKVVAAGLRGNDGYAMNGNAVMYDAGKILTVGGAPAYQAGAATRNAFQIDISAGPPNAPAVRKLTSMAYSRALSNSVVLPNGQVLIHGGQSLTELFSDDRAVLVPELWDPTTERFVRLAPSMVPRTYHSVALLLQDGRVLVGGGGLCGACATNHPDVQILTPPYLLKADGSPAARPSITAAPGNSGYGVDLAVSTDTAVASFALVRMGSSTHSVNTDQRRIPLKFRPGSGAGANNYLLSIPSDRGLLLPGQYMLFALDAAGVPSVSRVVRVG